MKAATSLFEAWQNGRWGLIGDHLRETHPGKTKRAVASILRDTFAPYQLEAFEILAVDHPMPVVAIVTVSMTVNGVAEEVEVRWTYQGAKGTTLLEGDEGGRWRTFSTLPEEYVRNAVPHLD